MENNAQACQTQGGHLLAAGPSKRCGASRACFLPCQVPHPRPLCVRRAPCRLSPRAGSCLLVGPFMDRDPARDLHETRDWGQSG